MRPFLKSLLRYCGLEVKGPHTELLYPIEIQDHERLILQRILEKRLTMVSPARLISTALACKHVVERGILGDFVECGVWRGGNSILAAAIFANIDPNRRVFLFDTFEGMTAPTKHDVEIATNERAEKKFLQLARETHNEWCYATLEDVRRNFAEMDIERTQAVFVKGDVGETLAKKQNLPERISVLRLDTDWYESTLAELRVLYPRLERGGILIVDDYGHWAGSKRAVDEYFSEVGKRPFFQATDHAGRAAVKE